LKNDPVNAPDVFDLEIKGISTPLTVTLACQRRGGGDVLRGADRPAENSSATKIVRRWY
jgi:hypothetical protein